LKNRAGLDELLNLLLPFAQQTLEKNGTFLPFAAALSADGEPRMVAGYTGKETSTAEELIELILSGLRNGVREGEYRAVGICFDARVTPPNGGSKTDAVQVSLENVEGDAVQIFLPYRKNLFRKIVYGELFASGADPQVFPVKS
jgi:hypothetical protein